MTQQPFDELSRSLDELNAGKTPVAASPETAELLEVAALLKQAGLPAAPPPHILDVTVQSAAAGLKASRASRNRWMYSGLLGAAASLLIFLGLQGLPDWRSAAPPAASSQQTEPATQTMIAAPPATPTANPAESKLALPPSAPPLAPAPAPSAPAAILPATPTAPAAAAKPAAPPAAPKLAARSAPVDTYSAPAPPALTPLRLPGRSPDLVAADPANGTLRQVFATGTAQELVIVQRPATAKANTAAPAAQPRTQPEAKTGANQGAFQLNTVVVVIAGQEVTLSGRQTRQELLDIAASLKP